MYEECEVKKYWVVYPVEESIAVFVMNENKNYDGAKIYASGQVVESIAIKAMRINVDDVFSN